MAIQASTHVSTQSYTVCDVVDVRVISTTAVSSYFIGGEPIDAVLGDEACIIASCESVPQTEPW